MSFLKRVKPQKDVTTKTPDVSPDTLAALAATGVEAFRSAICDDPKYASLKPLLNHDNNIADPALEKALRAGFEKALLNVYYGGGGWFNPVSTMLVGSDSDISRLNPSPFSRPTEDIERAQDQQFRTERARDRQFRNVLYLTANRLDISRQQEFGWVDDGVFDRLRRPSPQADSDLCKDERITLAGDLIVSASRIAAAGIREFKAREQAQKEAAKGRST